MAKIKNQEMQGGCSRRQYILKKMKLSKEKSAAKAVNDDLSESLDFSKYSPLF